MRPTWDEYFINLTNLIAQRSTCLQEKGGAIIVKDKKIMCTGYKGAPAGITNCLEAGCLRVDLNMEYDKRQEVCRGLHAPQNAIVQASLFGIEIRDAAIYVTNFPCIICMKMLINAGIRKVVIAEGEPDVEEKREEQYSKAEILSREMADYAGIRIIRQGEQG